MSDAEDEELTFEDAFESEFSAPEPPPAAAAAPPAPPAAPPTTATAAAAVTPTIPEQPIDGDSEPQGDSAAVTVRSSTGARSRMSQETDVCNRTLH